MINAMYRMNEAFFKSNRAEDGVFVLGEEAYLAFLDQDMATHMWSGPQDGDQPRYKGRRVLLDHNAPTDHVAFMNEAPSVDIARQFKWVGGDDGFWGCYET